jgi:Domain of unknown function (DUF4160)
MPTISRFYGIDIVMYFNDHAPAHFHAFNGDDEALIEWAPTPSVYRGSLPRASLKLVFDWATLHAADLDADWILARSGQPLAQIPPLP